jgi:hypothetical protein
MIVALLKIPSLVSAALVSEVVWNSSVNAKDAAEVEQK